MLNKSTLFFRGVAWFALTVFLYSFVAFEPAYGMATEARETKSVDQLAGKIDKFVLPYKIGRVIGGQYGGADSSDLVVFVQDLHCHPEVQKKHIRDC